MVENHNALNYDLFGNVLPEVKAKPVEVQSAPDKLDDDDFYFSTTKADVRKYTPVKEGQQHPVGKHGQLKLFHEHVWPKGYTPERLAQVREHAPPFLALDEDSHSDMSDIYDAERVENEYIDHMARSTVPIEDMQTMTSAGIVGEYDAHPKVEGTGAFSAHHRTFSVNAPSTYSPDRKLFRDIFGTRKNEESGVLIHELGHAHDFAQDPRFIFSGSKRPYHREGYVASPEKEGFAEGYKKKHNRATRAMKRNERYERKSGYETNKWLTPDSREAFRNTRRGAFEGTLNSSSQYRWNDSDNDI